MKETKMTHKTLKLKFVTVLFLLALGGISAAQAGKSPQEDIIHFVERYDNAWKQKDARAIERILAPDYVYFTSKGAVSSRQESLTMLLSPKYNLASAERSEMKVYLAPGAAVVSSRWKGQGTYEGGEFHDDQRCSIVLVKAKRAWQVLSEHCTQIAAP